MKRVFLIGAIASLVFAGCSGSGGTKSALPSLPDASSGSAPATVTAPPHYSITDLGANVLPTHLNDGAAVVGNIVKFWGDTAPAAFYWQGGALTKLDPLPGYTSAEANWINNNGEIVGTSHNSTNSEATEFVPGGADVALGIPPGGFYGASEARSVNDSGEAVGTAFHLSGQPPAPYVAVFHGADSAVVISDAPASGGTAYAINDGGEIAGGFCCPYAFPDLNTQAFTYPPNTILTMPSDSGEGATATDVNSFGHVVGYYGGLPASPLSPTCCGFYWHNGTMTELSDPTAPAGQGQLAAYALNDSDWIVGSFGGRNDAANQRAFLYIDKVIDLNTLIPANCGWLLQQATSINKSGQIVGYGKLNGVLHGFLLTPQP
jgi:hypothetical protein